MADQEHSCKVLVYPQEKLLLLISNMFLPFREYTHAYCTEYIWVDINTTCTRYCLIYSMQCARILVDILNAFHTKSCQKTLLFPEKLVQC